MDAGGMGHPVLTGLFLEDYESVLASNCRCLLHFRVQGPARPDSPMDAGRSEGGQPESL